MIRGMYSADRGISGLTVCGGKSVRGRKLDYDEHEIRGRSLGVVKRLRGELEIFQAGGHQNKKKRGIAKQRVLETDSDDSADL